MKALEHHLRQLRLPHLGAALPLSDNLDVVANLYMGF